MAEISYRRLRFPPVVIQHAVGLYLCFTLSCREVEDLLALAWARNGSEGAVSSRSTAGPRKGFDKPDLKAAEALLVALDA